MLGMSPDIGNRVQVTYIPSERDRQFVFGAATGNPSDYTANELVWITRESGVPTDYLSDTYMDFEVAVWDFIATAVEWKPGIGQIKQFNFVEKNNVLRVKPKKSVPFCLTIAVPLATLISYGCWIRINRSANHISVDMQSGQPKVEYFMQFRMEEAIYLMTRADYCVSVPFDKLADVICLFSFARYNPCLEYKSASY